MKKETIKELREYLIDELRDYKGKPIKLDLPQDLLEEILFEYQKNGSKVFSKELSSDIIHKIDFTGISFKDFLCNIDFTGIRGVIIKPQEVYDKKLIDAKLNGVLLDLDDGFDGVYLQNTSFKGAKAKDGSLITIDPQILAYRNMMECVFDGVVFTGSFNGTAVENAIFRGSIGAKIDPQTLINKSLKNTILCGVEFINNFIGVNVEFADFTGSKNAVINPQTILNKSLLYTKLTDAYVVGDDMRDVILRYTDFTGCKGEVCINPRTISSKGLQGCKLSGVRIVGTIEDCDLVMADFTGSIGAVIDTDSCSLYDTNLTDAKVYGSEEEEKEKEKIKSIIRYTITGKIPFPGLK